MRHLALASALAMLPLPAIAHPPGVFVAILAEKATGFSTLAECERAIARQPRLGDRQRIAKDRPKRGSLFNRAAGNTTRCEMVDGEPLIVVVPKGL